MRDKLNRATGWKTDQKGYQRNGQRSTSGHLLFGVVAGLLLTTCGGANNNNSDVEDEALVAIARGGKGVTRWRPKMSAARSERCKAVRRIVHAQARAHELEPHLMMAIAWVESGFSTTVRSHAGAVGLMQLLPHVSEAFGCTDPTKPRCAARAAVRLYLRLLQRFDGHDVYALCAYNAGAGRIRKAYRRGKTPFNYGYAERVFSARDRLIAKGCAAD